MNKYFALFLVFVFAGCASVPQQPGSTGVIPSPEETLIWASQTPPPAWIFSEPEATTTDMFFVGVSAEKIAAEQEARNDAYRTVVQNVVRYIGSYFKEKMEKNIMKYGLSSSILDPTKAEKAYEKFMSVSLAEKVKSSKWYIEKRQFRTTKETFCKVYVQAKVEKRALDSANKDGIDKVKEVIAQRDQVMEEKAKKQVDNALEMFDKMKEDGFK